MTVNCSYLYVRFCDFKGYTGKYFFIYETMFFFPNLNYVKYVYFRGRVVESQTSEVCVKI